jgi:uncharacterized RDD family membrane protein YckC
MNCPKCHSTEINSAGVCLVCGFRTRRVAAPEKLSQEETALHPGTAMSAESHYSGSEISSRSEIPPWRLELSKRLREIKLRREAVGELPSAPGPDDVPRSAARTRTLPEDQRPASPRLAGQRKRQAARVAESSPPSAADMAGVQAQVPAPVNHLEESRPPEDTSEPLPAEDALRHPWNSTAASKDQEDIQALIDSVIAQESSLQRTAPPPIDIELRPTETAASTRKMGGPAPGMPPETAAEESPTAAQQTESAATPAGTASPTEMEAAVLETATSEPESPAPQAETAATPELESALPQGEMASPTEMEAAVPETATSELESPALQAETTATPELESPALQAETTATPELESAAPQAETAATPEPESAAPRAETAATPEPASAAHQTLGIAPQKKAAEPPAERVPQAPESAPPPKIKVPPPPLPRIVAPPPKKIVPPPPTPPPLPRIVAPPTEAPAPSFKIPAPSRGTVVSVPKVAVPGAQFSASLAQPAIFSHITDKPHESKLILLSRTLAGLVDLIVIIVSGSALIFTVDVLEGIDVFDSVSISHYLLLLLVTYFVYSLFFLSTGAQTIGMMLTDLRLVGTARKRPKVTQLLVRCIAFLLGLAAFGVGLLWGFFNRQSRCLHDWISQTRVERISS